MLLLSAEQQRAERTEGLSVLRLEHAALLLKLGDAALQTFRDFRAL